MNNTTGQTPGIINTASGAADLPEALRRSTAADGKTELLNLPGYPLMVRAVDFNRLHTESEMRRTALLDEMQKAELAAGQATAAQPVVPAEWPTNEMIDAGRKAAASQGRLLGSGQSLWHVFRAMLAAAPAQPAAQQGAAYAALPEKYYLAGGEVPTWGAKQMRAFADATHTLRASHGQAPATQQAREVSDAMVLAALQVQHPAAYGQYLRHPANGPKTSIRTEAEIDTARRMIAAALAAATQPSPTAQSADSVQEDAARESEYRRGYRHGYEQRDAEVRGAMA